MQSSSRKPGMKAIALLLPALAAVAGCAGRADEPLATLLQVTPRTDLDAADMARVREITRPATQFDAAERFEALSGGAATVREKFFNRDIFSQPSANLDFEGRQRFQIGNG